MINHIKLSGNVLKKILLAGILEFTPIVIFLVSFQYFHIYKATIVLMIMTIISTVVTYRTQRRLPYLALYVALLTLIFGYLTISHREPRFIQIRDTLYDITCALTLLVGLILNISFLKVAFQKVVPMTMRAWSRLTYGWILFFITIALLNEYVRRTMSLEQWFSFKGIVALCTFIFGCSILYFVYEKEEDNRQE